MGTWGHKPFDNDSALDWRDELTRSAAPLALLQWTLGRIDPAWDGDVDEAQEALAAAAVVAAAGVEPIGSVDAEVRAWIAATGFVPDSPLVAAAAAAVERIVRDSELRDLRADADRLEPWLAQTRMVSDALAQIASGALPTRAPKRPGRLRALHKMAARYAEEPSTALRRKIADKFAALAAPDAPCAETDHESPLTLAARHGLLAEVEALLARGADPNVGQRHPRPFSLACCGGHVEVAERLRVAGAQVFGQVTAVYGDDDPMVRQYRLRGIEVKPPGYRYCVALFEVARRGVPAGADYLRALGADLHQTDLNGECLLYKAVAGGNLRMAGYLLDAGLSADARKGSNAESVLHEAARAGHLDMVELLLAVGANPNPIEKFEGKTDRWYDTPLDLVDEDERPELAALLRRHGARKAVELLPEAREWAAQDDG